jgi:hypothetical protein
MKAYVNLAADLPRHLWDADKILTRFGRWAMHRHHKRRCGSAEGHYRTPPNDDDRQPKELMLPPLDAMAVQRALSGVPERERIVLTVLYVPQRLPALAQLRILRIPPKLCAERHLAGIQIFDLLWRRAQRVSELSVISLTRG